MKKTVRILGKTLLGLSIIILLCTAAAYISGNGYIISALSKTYLKGHLTAGIDDHVDFDNNIIYAGKPQAWELHEKYNQIRLTDTLRKELEDFQTIGFAIIKDGKLLYEEYWENYSAETQTNSFSMAKSITTLLLGKAIKQRYIKNLDQPLTDFIPEFLKDSLGCLATVGDLSAMRSGLDWVENYYTPLNPTTEAYYGDSIEKQMLKLKFKEHPGGHYKYLSANTQLLATVLKRATGKSLAQYLSEEFWQPMGMEHDALWSISGGIEKSFCCVHSNVRDFAKLGQLMLQKGNWNGVQLLDTAFIDRMIQPDDTAFDAGEPKKYGYSIWIDETHEPKFYGMLGHLGQRILIVPDENIVIVRLGRSKDDRHPPKGFLDTDTYYFVDEVIKIIH
ncbi:MAG: beta-lactamase family protein [Dysgonamonadaceae bacterium]|jgi:CubicO group peptidase (beta-lactamase class C family)|nr:beta-lactamase family protein [Dysgonamonadaceae bacterium]